MDREKVIKGLECCSIPQGHCEKCPYETEGFVAECTSELAKDALALLKEQQAVVRCKDCKHRGDSLNCHVALIADLLKDTRVFTYKVTDEWFCADGERKEGR